MFLLSLVQGADRPRAVCSARRGLLALQCGFVLGVRSCNVVRISVELEVSRRVLPRRRSCFLPLDSLAKVGPLHQCSSTPLNLLRRRLGPHRRRQRVQSKQGSTRGSKRTRLHSCPSPLPFPTRSLPSPSTDHDVSFFSRTSQPRSRLPLLPPARHHPLRLPPLHRRSSDPKPSVQHRAVGALRLSFPVRLLAQLGGKELTDAG